MVWFVGVGSAVGGICRFLLGSYVQRLAGIGFPTGTLVINISGSLLLACLMRILLGSASISPEYRAALTTGFCGGYTTFSTFTFETTALLRDGEYARAGFYVGLSVLAGLAGAVIGHVMGGAMLAARRTI